jgi:3-methyladenine DNA glycosylase/8-oxoguanine DNA glycosylase
MRTLTLSTGRVVHASLREAHRRILVRIVGAVGPAEADESLRILRSCLRMDEDFSAFHRACRAYPRFRWIPKAGAGRMLRAPTAFEDAVKLICTTNCSWDLTTIMVRNMVAAFGKAGPGGERDFPTPGALAGATEHVLRRDIRSGYRAPYLLEFAGAVARGELDVESWRTSSAPTGALYDQMRTVRGIGPYTAGNLLKLAGRYDHLALDSWVRGRYYELYRGGRKVKDTTIEREYEKYGPWRGLLIWLEVTRDWHDGEFPLQL